MSAPSIIVLIQLLVILIASIALGGRGPVRSEPASEWAWVIVLAVVLAAEAFLILIRDHTLSGQMQFWVREHRLGMAFVVFWAWLTIHFVIEPAIRFVRNLLR